jgi:uncharacterized protein (DUF1697 family)
MACLIVLLRGINLAGRNRIRMPELREALAEAGFDDVRSYVQSGNIVLTSETSPKRTARACKTLIAERFGLDIDVVVRTRAELAAIVRRNPLGDDAVDPRRYQVTFLDAHPHPDVVKKLAELATPPEKLVHVGRELYAWHPDGIGRSKLAAKLSGPGLGVVATARNWATVTKLLELADEA